MVVGGGGVAGAGGRVNGGGAAVVGLVASGVFGVVFGEGSETGPLAFAVRFRACRSR